MPEATQHGARRRSTAGWPQQRAGGRARRWPASLAGLAGALVAGAAGAAGASGAANGTDDAKIGGAAQLTASLPPQAFARCAACHADAAASATAAQVGPPLAALAGRRAGSQPGFRYSGPLARSGLSWDAATLAAFLRDPQASVPGNRMAFSGVDDAQELQALVAWLLRDSNATSTLAARTAP